MTAIETPIRVVDGIAYREGSTDHIAAIQSRDARKATVKAAMSTEPTVRYYKDGSYRVENMDDVKALVTHLRAEGLSKSKAKKVAHHALHNGRYLRQEFGTATGSAPDYQHAGQSASRPNGLDDKRITKREKLQWRERSLKPTSTFIARPDGPFTHFITMGHLPRLTKLERDILHGKVEGTTRDFGSWANQRVRITH